MRICVICGMPAEEKVCSFCQKVLERKQQLEKALSETYTIIDAFTITLPGIEYVHALNGFLLTKNKIENRLYTIHKMLINRSLWGVRVKQFRENRIWLRVKFNLLKTMEVDDDPVKKTLQRK